MTDEHDRQKDIEAEGQRAALHHASIDPRAGASEKQPDGGAGGFKRVYGSEAAHARARALAEAVGPVVARQGSSPLDEAARALEEIARISANAWGTPAEQDGALRRINEVALLAWANLRRRP